jgi:hypothetical protein
MGRQRGQGRHFGRCFRRTVKAPEQRRYGGQLNESPSCEFDFDGLRSVHFDRYRIDRDLVQVAINPFQCAPGAAEHGSWLGAGTDHRGRRSGV